MQMPSDVTLVAFDVLMDFVDLYDYVKRDSKVSTNLSLVPSITHIKKHNRMWHENWSLHFVATSTL